LKKSCSGYVRVISLRITFSQGDVIFINSAYWFFASDVSTLVKHCQSNGRKCTGTPDRIKSFAQINLLIEIQK
jgi:hypothetical protein